VPPGNPNHPRDEWNRFRIDYTRRGQPRTVVYKRVIVEVRTIQDMRRRVHWRCRELGIAFRTLCERSGVRNADMYKALARPRITENIFNRIDALLQMDEVDGWDRPFPDFPARKDRQRLADVTRGGVLDMLAEIVGDEEEGDG